MAQMIADALRRLEVNRAVFFSALTQIWSTVAGPATALIIAHWLSPEEQGFYYTFGSVLALQVFVELGLATVIVQTASHEWAFLRRAENGGVEGDPHALSRLASLMRFALRYYAACAVVAAIGLGVGGILFFGSTPRPGIVWQIPWLALCAFTGLALLTTPLLSLLEGCNQVGSIYGFRFVSGVLASVTIILSIVLGSGLYVLPIASLVRILWRVTFLVWKYRRFLWQLYVLPLTERVAWRRDVWPFQWRISVSWLAGYFIFSLFNPVMFHYHGAVVAGQMGMTWALVNAVSRLASSWLQTRAPKFGMLIARRDYGSLDKLFRRLTFVATGIATLGSGVLWLLVLWLHASGLAMAHRILPILPVTLLLLAGILNTWVNALAVYLRAHKREPLMWLSLASGVLTGLAVWLLGARIGPVGAAAGYLGVSALWGLPSVLVVFARCRAQWHADMALVDTPAS